MPLLIFCYIRTLKTILVWTSDPLIPLCWRDPLSPGACPFTMDSQLLAPGLHTPSTFQFCLAIHSLPSIFSRIYRALGHSLFPVCPSSLWRLVNGLHKLGFIDQLISSRFQPIGGTSRRSELGRKESWNIYSITSLPAEQKFARGFFFFYWKPNSKRQKIDGWFTATWERGKWGMIANAFGALVSDKNILELDSGDSWKPYRYTKTI